MKHLKSVLMILPMLLIAQTVWGWDGSGTEADPYLIQNQSDWKDLYKEVRYGDSFKGKVFRLTNDLDIQSMAIGSDDCLFSGIFDGDGHTLTYNAGSGNNRSEELCAPFAYVNGATIRHLRTTGYICTTHQFAAGIVGLTRGINATTLLDCSSDMDILSEDPNHNDASGGLVGAVASGGLNMEQCMFEGYIRAYNGAGLVGWSNVPVTLTNCLVSPTQFFGMNTGNGENLVRMAGGVEATITDCYYTMPITGSTQGKACFSEILLPEGCTYRIIDAPTFHFNGINYYTDGVWVELTVPEGMAFNHWQTNAKDGCYISNPWVANGLHQIRDVKWKPNLTIATELSQARLEREMDGTRYRYLTREDYHLFFSNEEFQKRGYEFEDNSYNSYVIKKVDGSKCYITAVVGWKAGSIPEDGLQIHNDLSGVFHDYTLLACIAPQAFKGCTELKSLYFKDSDANNYNAQENFCIYIGDQAFADCPNLTEVKLMQYTTKGSNHWEMIRPEQITDISMNAFDGSPQAKISCHRDVYQKYLGSELWKPFYSRFIVYDATVTDFTIDGVKYHTYRNTDETQELTNANQDVMLRNHVRVWNASYRNFNAADLLKINDDARVFYTSVVGVDDDDIDDQDGKMVILNDLGTYYNYKNICLGRNALAGNKHVKSIEFRQVNGDRTSHSDLKMVIQNGAFTKCSNLKELRLFYWCEDGDDHWEVLGPENVIPGNNIFGIPQAGEAKDLTKEQLDEYTSMLKDFKILVSPDRYNDFLDDPNWIPYMGYLEPVDYNPTNDNKDFTIGDADGIIYNYITNTGGIMVTSQTVSQDVSWWTAPRIIAEVALKILELCTGNVTTSEIVDEAAASEAREAAEKLLTKALPISTELAQKQALYDEVRGTVFKDIMDVTVANVPNCDIMIERLAGNNVFSWGATLEDCVSDPVWAKNWEFLVKEGCINPQTGQIASKEVLYQTMDKIGKEEGKEFAQSLFTDHWFSIYGISNHALKGQISRLTYQLGNLFENTTLPFQLTEKSVQGVQSSLNDYLTSLVVTGSKWSFNTAGFKTWATVNTAGVISSQVWGGVGSYEGESLKKGIRENILSNIHQVGMTGGGYIISTPQKNLVYHAFIKEVKDNVEHAVIYAGTDKGQGKNANARTMTMAKNAFRNKKNLKKVSFFENNVSTNEAIPMLLTIPDSAFVGCDNLTEFNTILQTDNNGERALGPESFILAGDSIFAGLDSTKFHIVIDKTRKNDYLFNESWAPYKKYFVYGEAKAKNQHKVFGVQYAYAYENGSTQKVHKVSGHKIEHTFVNGVDNDALSAYSGAASLLNDIGEWNNYQLDYIAPNAFKNNDVLRRVQFADLAESMGPIGECYTGLDVTIMDSCFANCGNLQTVDLVYCVNDQPNVISQIMSFNLVSNHIVPMTPQMIKITGKDVFFNSPGKLKMMPRQVSWFEADSTWAQYKDKFMPCIISPADAAVKKVLGDYRYRFYEGYKTYWYDDIDLSYLPYRGYGEYDIAPLVGKFPEYKDKFETFSEFKYFETIGIKEVPESFFDGCYKLRNILLPSTLERIEKNAFRGCTSLKELVIPENVFYIADAAFGGTTGLNTIRLPRRTTLTDIEGQPFHAHDGLKIVVPDSMVATYKADQRWKAYAAYIVGENECPISKKVTVSQPGQLAQALGLNTRKEKGKVRYIDGFYAKYDSLTVSGPLNGDDLGLIRYLAGADAYDSDPTDGQLRYLDLWNADIKKDLDNAYNGNGMDEYTDEDNKIGDYLFENCTALETIIFPKTVTYIGENVFEDAISLKRVCVGLNTTGYECDIFQNLENVEQLVLLTENHATSEYSDPWEAPIGSLLTLQSQIGNYMGDPCLQNRAQNITAIFQDDAVTKALAESGNYFYEDYIQKESVEGIFEYNKDIRHFDDFWYFDKVKVLDRTFHNAVNLRSITLPKSIERIGREAFTACPYLKTIQIACDSVPELAQDAFEDLVPDFEILVPNRLCKLYRTKWPQYADHINVHHAEENSEIVSVTLTEPNTLAEALGLTKTLYRGNVVKYIGGDYSKLRKIKVSGPISGNDFDVMKNLCGYNPWSQERNFFGQVEYIDLYDAVVVESTGTMGEAPGYKFHTAELRGVGNNIFPVQALLKAYSLKTLILPRSCYRVAERAFQECDALETLVIGDDCTDFRWSALDDDVMLTRCYILSKEKIDFYNENPVWNSLCNNYNPTFDAFYVRPSQLETYRADDNFTGSSWQRTNNIQSGIFADDAGFTAFAAHAAATSDDLAQVTNVEGWFKQHPGITDLTPLRYTAVKELKSEDLRPLKWLQRIATPVTLENLEDSLFNEADDLRFVDLLVSDSTMIVSKLRESGFKRLGIDSLKTLVYVPKFYGESDGVNIICATDSTGLKAKAYRLVDEKDYLVPYPFETSAIENSRVLTVSSVPYTMCLPYRTTIPKNSRAYKLDKREGSMLTFIETKDTLQAMMPYLIKVVGNKRLRKNTVELSSNIRQTIPSSSGNTIGQQQNVMGYSLRGTLVGIDNQKAWEMGAYILQEDGDWHLVGNDTEEQQKARILPFRAYLLQNEGGLAAPRLSMDMIDATEIETIETIDLDGTARYYDLNGRELPGKPEKGFYIHNGKKYYNK